MHGSEERSLVPIDGVSGHPKLPAFEGPTFGCSFGFVLHCPPPGSCPHEWPSWGGGHGQCGALSLMLRQRNGSTEGSPSWKCTAALSWLLVSPPRALRVAGRACLDTLNLPGLTWGWSPHIWLEPPDGQEGSDFLLFLGAGDHVSLQGWKVPFSACRNSRDTAHDAAQA